MANGKIIIDVELNDDGVLKGLKNIEGMGGGSAGKKDGGLIGGMFGGMKNIIGAGLALKGVQAAWNALKSGISGGISRYDTMQRFPRMMQQIGFTSGEADQAIQSLSDGIQGLPTALDTVTGTAQQIALMTGDLTGAVDTTIALNNAFLASGSSSADASRGMVQFQQMLARGEPDLQSWRTLMETMPVALSMVSEELGYSGDNLYDLYDAMQAGEITFDDFTNALIALNKEQGGLADMALENSKGIATSWQNVSTAISRGWANILDATDRGLERLGLGSIADQINNLKGVVDTGFSAVVSGIDWVTRQAVKLQPVFSEIGRQVTGFLEPLRESAGRFFKPVIDGFGEIGEAATHFGHRMNGVLRAIGEGNWQSAWNIFKNASLQAFEHVGTAFSNMWTGMQESFKDIEWRELGTNILSGIQDGIRTARGLVTTIGQAIKGFIFNSLGAQSWGEVGETVMSGIITGIESAVSLVMVVGGAIKSMIFTALDAENWGDVAVSILSGIATSIGTVGSLVLGAGQAIKEWVFDETGAQSWGEVAQVVLERIGNQWNNFTHSLGEVGATISGWVFEKTGAESWEEVARMTFSRIGEAWGLFRSALGEVGSTIKNWVFERTGAESWGEVASMVFESIGQQWETAKNKLGEIGSIIKGWIFEKFEAEDWGEVGQSLLTSVGDALEAINWESVGQSVGEFLGNALIGIGAFLGEVGTSVDWGKLISGLETGISNAFSEIDFGKLAQDFFSSFEMGFDPTHFEWGPIGKKVMEALGFEIEQSGPADPDVDVEPEIREVTVQNPEKVDEEITRGVGGREGGRGGRGGSITVNRDVVARIMEIALEGKGPMDIERMIDDEFGMGTYQSVITPEIMVEIGELLGADESTLRMMVDEKFGAGTYDTLIDVEVETNPEVMESHTLEPELQGVIKGQVIEPIEKDIVVNPNIVVGHSAGGGGLAEEGAQPGSLAGGGMFARLIEQVNQGMVQVQEAVTQGMTQVNETITLQTQQWSISMVTGMIGMTMAVATGMIATTLAVTVGMASMSLAVTTGFIAMMLAVTLNMGLIESAVTSRMTEISSSTDTAMTEMSSVTETTMTEMSTAVDTAMTEASAATDTAMTEMSSATDTAMTEMQSATESAMDAMVGAVEGGMDSAVGAVESGVDSIIASLQSVETPAFNAGLNIGYGLARGINASAPVAIAAAQYLANSVNNILNSVFRFGSPSKVTTQYGEWIGEGLGNGIRNSLKYVNRSSDLLGQYAIPSINTNRAIGLGGYGSAGAMSYQNEVNLHIGTFVNNREEDLPQLMEEIRYYENVRLQGGM